MYYVNNNLQRMRQPGGLEQMLRHSFICHHCKYFFKSHSKELFFFIEEDAVYHQHENVFYRAFEILDDGVIRIGAFDSVEENVIQGHRIEIDSSGGLTYGRGEGMRSSSKNFFEAMKQQNRDLQNAKIDFRLG